TKGPIGSWVAASLRTGTTRRELFPGFRERLNALVRDGAPIEPVLTVLPGGAVPLPAQVHMTVVDRAPRREPHLVLVAVRDFTDGRGGPAPFDVAVHRALVTDMGVEAVVTTSDLRITWASAAFEARAGAGDVV